MHIGGSVASCLVPVARFDGRGAGQGWWLVCALPLRRYGKVSGYGIIAGSLPAVAVR